MGARARLDRGDRGQSVVKHVPEDRPGDSRIESWIGVAVSLAPGVGHDGGGPCIHGQSSRRGCDAVVGVAAQAHGDGISTHARGGDRGGRQGVVQRVPAD